VQAVARENALFAIATALPNVVPNFLELPWAVSEFASDTVFLTVNQIRMAFLIAAASGAEVGLGSQKGEILSIAAGALGWRAIARELAGKIPLGGGLIPKGAIAYAATFVIGKSLEYYHRNSFIPLASAKRFTSRPWNGAGPWPDRFPKNTVKLPGGVVRRTMWREASRKEIYASILHWNRFGMRRPGICRYSDYEKRPSHPGHLPGRHGAANQS
jgi:uncharacterized protein (DUF697 family)